MNIQEAAQILDLHPRTIRRMLRDGRLEGMIIPPCYPGGRHVYRLDADYVHQIRAGGNQKPTPLLNLESLNG